MFVCSMKKKQLFLCMIGFVLFAVGVAWLVGAVCKAARPQPQPMTEAAMAAYIESHWPHIAELKIQVGKNSVSA